MNDTTKAELTAGDALAGRRHPLPFSLQDGWVTLGSQSRGNEDRPYALHLGRHGGVIASLSTDELRELRDRITDVLAATFRVIPAGGTGHSYDDPYLETAVHDRLNHLLSVYPHLEVASESEPTPAGHLAEQWALANGVPVVVFRSMAEAMAAGGDRVIIVAGPDGPDLAGSAHDAGIAIDLIRLGAPKHQQQDVT